MPRVRSLEDAHLAFWRERHLCTVPTLRRDGSPHVVPMGVVVVRRYAERYRQPRENPAPLALYGHRVNRRFFLRRNFARLVLGAAHWKTAGTVPKRAVLVGAPHTSNWDWVLTMVLAWDNNIQIKLLVKKEFFRGPLAPLLRATGAIELDRADPGVTIRDLLVEAEGDEPFVLGMAPEGTRSKGEHWKSGFYRIAQQSGLPITLAFIDAPSRTVGWGPTFSPTANVRADMDRIREFYADKTGIKPEGFTPPRLREEPGS